MFWISILWKLFEFLCQNRTKLHLRIKLGFCQTICILVELINHLSTIIWLPWNMNLVSFSKYEILIICSTSFRIFSSHILWRIIYNNDFNYIWWRDIADLENKHEFIFNFVDQIWTYSFVNHFSGSNQQSKTIKCICILY